MPATDWHAVRLCRKHEAFAFEQNAKIMENIQVLTYMPLLLRLTYTHIRIIIKQLGGILQHMIAEAHINASPLSRINRIP